MSVSTAFDDIGLLIWENAFSKDQALVLKMVETNMKELNVDNVVIERPNAFTNIFKKNDSKE